MFKQYGNWQVFTFVATNDLGLFRRLNPMNDTGTEVLVPGQYKGAFSLGLNNGYEALTPARVLPVYRDDDCDVDMDINRAIDNGWHGINLHPANAATTSSQVDKWYASCQVIEDLREFDMQISICKRATREWGPKVTYTLIEEADLK